MQQHLAVEALGHPVDQFEIGDRRKAKLQIGDRGIDPDRMQRGVVPGELIERWQPATPPNAARCASSAERRNDTRPSWSATSSSNASACGSDTMTMTIASPGAGNGQPLQIRHDMRVVHGNKLLGDAVAFGEIVRETRGRRQRRECSDPFAPGMAGRKRHLDLGDDAVHTIGVHDLEHVPAAQLDQPWLRLDGDHLNTQHGARIGNLPPRTGAGAGGAAGDKAADGRVLAGGRVEPQLMTGGHSARSISSMRAPPSNRPAPGRCQIIRSSRLMSSTTPPASGTAWP